MKLNFLTFAVAASLGSGVRGARMGAVRIVSRATGAGVGVAAGAGTWAVPTFGTDKLSEASASINPDVVRWPDGTAHPETHATKARSEIMRDSWKRGRDSR